MTTAQKYLITLQVVGFLIILAYLVFHLVRAKQEVHKYRLYALRDRLLYLLAKGELREDSLIFKVFYNTIIRSICEIKDVKLWSIAKASVAARSVLQQQREEQLRSEAMQSSPEVKKFIIDFYRTMMEIALANSPLLVLFVKLASHNVVLKVGRYLRKLKLFINEQQQYDVYRYF